MEEESQEETSQNKEKKNQSKTYSVVTWCHIKYGEEGQPDDAGGVHGKTYELGFVEIFWTLPRFKGIYSA